MFCDEFQLVDLRLFENCKKVVQGCEHVFNLAADMGGMGFIQSNHSVILFNNTMISYGMLEAARESGVKRYDEGQLFGGGVVMLLLNTSDPRSSRVVSHITAFSMLQVHASTLNTSSWMLRLRVVGSRRRMHGPHRYGCGECTLVCDTCRVCMWC